jgi:DNA mismatch repair protein MSH5
MDVHIGDLHSTIVDRELEIIEELLEEVLKCDEAISAACDVCAELDCLLSFSEASRVHNFERPEMTDENVIDIVQGRFVADIVVLDPQLIYVKTSSLRASRGHFRT